VTGSGTGWSSSGLNAGDKFILEANLSAKVEPGLNWGTIESIDSDTQITLDANYSGTTGAFSPSAYYRARKVYTTPSNERWQYAVVGGKFSFVNGDSYAQYWGGTDPESGGSTPNAYFATNLNTTYAYQARYCLAYGRRLLMADMYNTTTAARDQWLLRYSKIGDPTNYTDNTAGTYSFYETEDPITGLGMVGTNLLVYKKTMFHVGYMSGQPTDPFVFHGYRKGVGLYAPYSLVHYRGTNAFLGVDDFYTIDGDMATPIGGPIRKKFFGVVSDDDLQNVFGVDNPLYSEIVWVANTSSGQYAFSWNYQENSWSAYEFTDNLSGLGSFGF